MVFQLQEDDDWDDFFGFCRNPGNGDWFVFYRVTRFDEKIQIPTHEEAYRDYDLHCMVFDKDGTILTDSPTGLIWPIGHTFTTNGRFIAYGGKIYYSYVSRWDMEYDPYIRRRDAD